MIGNEQIHKMDNAPRPIDFPATSFLTQISRYIQQTEGQNLLNDMVKRFFLLAALAAASFSLAPQAWAFEVDTHKQLTDKAIESL